MAMVPQCSDDSTDATPAATPLWRHHCLILSSTVPAMLAPDARACARRLGGSICPGEDLLSIELEEPLQHLGLGGGAREHEASAVQVARAVRADIGRRPARTLTVSRIGHHHGLPRAGAGAGTTARSTGWATHSPSLRRVPSLSAPSGAMSSRLMPREKAARLNELPEELLCPLLVGGACWIAQRSTKVADELLDVLRRTQLIAAGSPSQSSGHPYQQGPIEHLSIRSPNAATSLSSRSRTPAHGGSPGGRLTLAHKAWRGMAWHCGASYDWRAQFRDLVATARKVHEEQPLALRVAVR